MRQELAAVAAACPLFSDEESAATADSDGSRPRTALPSAAAVEEDQGGEEQGDDGEDAAQDSTGQEEQEGESAGGSHGQQEREQGAVDDCGGPGAGEGKAAAVSKDGRGQLAHKAGLAAPDQAGLTALQIKTASGATEIESARGIQAGEVAVALPSHTKSELADHYKLKWHGPTPSRTHWAPEFMAE